MCQSSGRIESRFGMITHNVCVDAVTRDTGSPPPLGRMRAHFHVLAGTVTWPFASVLVTPPLLPVPPMPFGPETMKSSFAGMSAQIGLEVFPRTLIVAGRL